MLPSPTIPGSFSSSPFSFLSTDTKPLTFFEYYSLDLQKQKQQKQAAKKQIKEKVQKQKGVVIQDQEQDLYPSQDVTSKNPEKQPVLNQQLTISVTLYEDTSSDQEDKFSELSSVHIDTYDHLSQQVLTETPSSGHSSWSTEDECADLTEILMADPQPSSSAPQPSTATEHVSEMESDTEKTNKLHKIYLKELQNLQMVVRILPLMIARLLKQDKKDSMNFELS
jgi:hypothetical protein